MKYLVLIFTLPVLVFGSLEGKRTYGGSYIEKKVEKLPRHKENPTKFKSVKVNKVITGTKGNVHTTLKNPKLQEKKRILQTSKTQRLDLKRKVNKNKVLKTSKNNLSNLKKEMKQKKNSSAKKSKKKYVSKTKKMREAKAYKKVKR